ncbi:MAG: hypothetical protein Q8N08_05875 [Methanobacteriaceae archaeon]|nr:hypothetical protein [Methanobacteriaceae archaeon]
METHPRTVQKILGIKDVNHYVNQNYTVPGNPTEHELDAFLAAFTGLLCLDDCYMELENPEEGSIILPGTDCLKQFL